MRATAEYVRARFDYFNLLCFEGKLPPIAVRITNAKSYLGKVTCRKERGLFRGERFRDFQMLISNRRDLDPFVIDDTILHEMIHYHILYNRIKDTSAHGPVFRKIMTDFNRRFGRRMTVSHRVTEEEHDRNQERKANAVCVARMKDGRTAIMVAARSALFNLWDGMEKWEAVAEHRWIYSDHPYFGRFPRSRTLKLYHADPDSLQEALLDARPLKRVGTRIEIRKKEAAGK